MMHVSPTLPYETGVTDEQFPGVYINATVAIASAVGEAQLDASCVYSHVQLLAEESSHSGSALTPAHLDVYTNQPEVVAKLYREGFSALDDIECQQILMFTADGSHTNGTAYLQGACFDVTDGILTIDNATLVTDEKDKLNALFHEHGNSNGNTDQYGLRNLWDVVMRQVDGSRVPDLSYDGLSNYRSLHPIVAAFKELGVKTHHYGYHQEVPTPGGLKQRLNILRKRAEQNGDTALTYYPDVKFFTTGEIPPRLYLESYAEGKHPISTSDPYYYAHDLLHEHFEAFLVYGEPFMELVQFAAANALASANAADTPDESTRIINACTDGIDGLSAGFGEKNVMAIEWEFNEANTKNYESLIATIKSNEDFKNLRVVRSLLERKVVKNVKDITLQHISSEVRFMARRELGVPDQQYQRAARMSGLLKKMRK